MELRTMRYFLEVARKENMTKAAEILHVTQPTLSKQLKQLEDELGQKLFIRHSFSIQLTDEGRLLKKRAEDLVAMADKIADEFHSIDDVTGGDIFLGLAESYQIQFLARTIRFCKEKYPNMKYHITSGGTDQVTDMLDKGLIDFAVLVESPNYAKYNVIEFPEADVWGVVMPAYSVLAQKSEITVDDLFDLPLFCSEQSWDKDIPRWCGEKINRLNLEGSFQLSYNASIFVKEGLGYLLTFNHLIDTSPESGLIFRPLSPQLINKMYLIWQREQVLSPIAQRFLEEIHVVIGA